jgi:polysaccharide export outer membrane protein
MMIKRILDLGWAFAASLLLAPALVANAQAPSEDQMQIFRNLSPEQQQMLLQQLGSRDGASATSSPERRSATPTGANRNESETLDAERRRRLKDEEKEPLIAVMKPEDTVLLQVELPERRIIPVAPSPTVPGQTSPLLSGSVDPALQAQAPNAAGANEALNRRFLEPIEREDAERKKLEDLVDLLRSRNPYRLGRDASLTLPGFAPIALGGLTELQATQRLSAEPALFRLQVKLVRLPISKNGLEGLKRFGYDLFDEAPSTFSPVTEVPVPAEYVVGVGDELSVQLFGTRNTNLRLVVGREGTVSFPELGPINVAGMTFSAAKQTIEGRVARQLIGVRANVQMGELRAIRVFVLGEAKQPGSYTVSGLATMTTALFGSGGVKPIGSLRDIQLKRQGQVVRRLDLYDLLIKGNTSDDAKLVAGDVIFIPPVGPTVSVDGEVKRPAIYELRGESTLGDLVGIAGGLTPESDPVRGSLTRIEGTGRRVVLPVDLSAAAGNRVDVKNGDVLRIARLRPQLDSGVVLDGFVWREGPLAWREGLRLSDVIGSVDELKPNADQNYVLIRRESGPDRRISVLSADLNNALAAPGSAADVLLQPRDHLTVFDKGPGRERIIKPLLDELRLQSELSRPTEVVRVQGRVKVPGEYPLETDMTVRDLLRAGGNLETSAYGGKAELARYTVTDTGAHQTELIDIDLAAVRRGDVSANVMLRPFDYLLVKETPDWGDHEEVTLKGEVRFPGTYPIRRGETLHDLMMRAGGLAPSAFPRGAAFVRKEIKENEKKQLDLLADRMAADVATLSLQAAAANQEGASSALMAGQSLLAQLRTAKPVGRMIIDLPALLAGKTGGVKDVILRDGDELVVPKLRQEVMVIGEVQGATSHLYTPSLKRDNYIDLSGGTTRKADRGRIYVVRANGSVVSERRSLFTRSYDVAVEPGDTIVVPLDAERMPKLQLWQAVTQIIYNLAISAAAINSF